MILLNTAYIRLYQGSSSLFFLPPSISKGAFHIICMRTLYACVCVVRSVSLWSQFLTPTPRRFTNTKIPFWGTGAKFHTGWELLDYTNLPLESVLILIILLVFSFSRCLVNHVYWHRNFYPHDVVNILCTFWFSCLLVLFGINFSLNFII